MTAKIFDFATRSALILESRKKDPNPKYPMLVAAEHERIAENARRTNEAMAVLDTIPSDSEAQS